MLPTSRLAALVIVAAAGSALAAPSADGGAPTAKSCVKWTTEARYRPYGYDHLVHLNNGCDKPARCHVKTNVNPEPAEVRVLPKQSATVVTFQGSPAREFTAEVSCALEE